jgi:amino acid transporter
MTAAAAVERQKLQRHFGRFDILFFLICTIVGVDTIATVAQGGGQAFTWMMVFAVVFFVPQALLFAELGSAFPQEGGPYFWTRLAFGHLAGAVNNFLYWITNPVWIGGSLTITCITAVEVFFNHGASVSTAVWFLIALVFVWLSIVAAITSFSVGKWLPTAGAIARFVVLGLFTISVISYALKHGAHGLGASDYKPSESGFVLRGDDQPAAGRAVRHRPLHRGERGALRPARDRHPDRPARQRHHQLQRIRQRDPDRLHRLRRPRQRHRRGHAERGRPRPG